MIGIGLYFAGFASGWAVRSTVDSSRTLAVKLLAGVYGLADKAGRAAGMEREHLEDLLAEARAMYEAARARETQDPKAGEDEAPDGHRAGGVAPVVSVRSARGRAA